MSQQDAFAEAVFFFDGNEVGTEMHYAEFEALLNGAATLQAFAASQVRGVYVVVGTGLSVRGVVCFVLRIDENGHADRDFSIPLRHLVRHAGPGPDVGCGPIRLSCKSQCSVSWHATNMWEPEGVGEANPIKVVQRAVWRNRLGLKLTKAEEVAFPATPAGLKAEKQHKLEQAFGDEGRVSLQQLIRQHNQNLETATRKYRSDLEAQQQIYLDQVRGCRDEIQRLKSLLRHEQSRNRRLQQLLRGETDR
ncbi:MAG: hypothetical protein HC809_04070 [Gammaproteobacteria bacterium]|nr:hypothetical protein [Gammaproteobacteria bacterium]